MNTSCSDVLLMRLDQAAEEVEFPLWQCGEVNAVVGAMRASGFSCGSGAALVFEQIEHAIAEGFIQCLTFCVATFPVRDWTLVGEGVLVNVRVSEQGDLPFDFGVIEIQSRDRGFKIELNREELASSGYLGLSQDGLSVETLLFRVCDVVPREWLFSEEEFLKQAYKMPSDATRCFIVENWEHPTFDQIYADSIKPSAFSDIRSMAEAACSGKGSPRLSQMSNTNWRTQCRS